MEAYDPFALEEDSAKPDLRFPFPIQNVQDRNTRPSAVASTTRHSVRTSRLPMRRSEGPEVEWDRDQPEPLRGPGDSTKYNHPLKGHWKASPANHRKGRRTLTANIAMPASTSAWAERQADEMEDESSDEESNGGGEDDETENESYDGGNDPLAEIVQALEAEAEAADKEEEEGDEGESVTVDTEALDSGPGSGAADVSGAGNATQQVPVKRGDRLPMGKQHIEGVGECIYQADHHRHDTEAALNSVFPRTVQKRCLRSLAHKGGPEVRDDTRAPNPTADVLELAVLVERLGNPTIEQGFRLYVDWMFGEEDLHVFNNRFLTSAGRKETLTVLAMLLGRAERRQISNIEKARDELRERHLYTGKAAQEWLRGADGRSLELGYMSSRSDYLMVKAAIAVLDGGYFPLLALPDKQHQHVASTLQSTLSTNAARSFGSLLRWRVDQLVERATNVVPPGFRGLERVRATLRRGALEIMLEEVVSQGAASMTRKLLGAGERSALVDEWATTLADALNRELGIVRSKCGWTAAPVAMADVVGQPGGVMKLAPYLHAVAMERGKNPRGLIPVSVSCLFYWLTCWLTCVRTRNTSQSSCDSRRTDYADS